MKQAVFGTVALLALSAAIFLLCEGIYAVLRWDVPETSIAYRSYARFIRAPDNSAGRDGPPTPGCSSASKSTA